MLRIIFTFLLIFLSYLFQTSIFSMIPFIQTEPNMLMIITITVGVLRGKEEGILTGLFCGLFLDLMSGGYIGFYGLAYMYIGLMCGFLYQHIDIDIPLIPIVLITLGELVYHMYIFVFRFLLRGRLGLGIYFKSIILPELVITVVTGIFFYGLLMLLNGILEDNEKRRALKFV